MNQEIDNLPQMLKLQIFFLIVFSVFLYTFQVFYNEVFFFFFNWGSVFMKRPKMDAFLETYPCSYQAGSLLSMFHSVSEVLCKRNLNVPE